MDSHLPRNAYLRGDKRKQKQEAKKAQQEQLAKENTEQASCIGKYPFDTYTEAKRVANYGVQDVGAGRHLRAYKCPICHKFHIGAGARRFPPDVLSNAKLKSMEELLALGDIEWNREDEDDVVN